jgi:DNA adenine methylase
MTALAPQASLPISLLNEPMAEDRKPFLKWAGNKNRVKHHIIPRLPAGKRLIEPFAGSCAISLATDFESYLIADANADLIDMYDLIKKDHANVIRQTELFFQPLYNEAEAFYNLRDEFNRSTKSIRKSAIFIYLNRHCFNGLCRYNASGGFNVPFGKYRAPNCPSLEIERFAEFAQRAEFKHQSFEDTFAMAEEGDVIYCDPPYVPLSATSNFTSYAKESFGPLQQQALADAAIQASANGIPTLISNHDVPFARDIYTGAHIEAFEVQRLISSKASTRGLAPELLAIFNA